ncbi:MAG: DUF2817 domain-containing protein, partial [Planctomycetota bacterium]
IDLHTGLGRWADFQLLVESDVNENQRDWLWQFGKAKVLELAGCEPAFENKKIYQASGSFGHWCDYLYRQELGIKNPLFAVLEFGTYSPLQMLKVLRRENQAQHWLGQAGKELDNKGKASKQREKRRLLEAFCPKSPEWRKTCCASGLDFIQKAQNLLEEGSA